MKPESSALLQRLSALRFELETLAVSLERQGSREAADVAMTTSARLAALCEVARPALDFVSADVRIVSVGSLDN